MPAASAKRSTRKGLQRFYQLVKTYSTVTSLYRAKGLKSRRQMPYARGKNALYPQEYALYPQEISPILFQDLACGLCDTRFNPGLRLMSARAFWKSPHTNGLILTTVE